MNYRSGKPHHQEPMRRGWMLDLGIFLSTAGWSRELSTPAGSICGSPSDITWGISTSLCHGESSLVEKNLQIFTRATLC